MSFIPRITAIRLPPLGIIRNKRLIPAVSRCLHSSSPHYANLLPVTAHGPPPKPPLPIVSEISELRQQQKAVGERFWKEVRVEEGEDGYEILLDNRSIPTPLKKPLIIPLSKPILANAIALEWSLLGTSADARTKRYLTPLTQLASRVIDMADPEASTTSREQTISNLMRYLETDTLICYAPTTPLQDRDPNRKTLRERQSEEAMPVISWLTTVLWPGIALVPNDGDFGFMSVTEQPAETRQVIRSWMEGLSAWDLVGLEIATLGSKSLLIGARLIAEWSEDLDIRSNKSFGIEEAAKAASVEVRYQTERWGEVEDTHDVEREDSKRQLGAALMLVMGLG